VTASAILFEERLAFFCSGGVGSGSQAEKLAGSAASSRGAWPGGVGFLCGKKENTGEEAGEGEDYSFVSQNDGSLPIIDKVE
jgi:hypothetical protein